MFYVTPSFTSHFEQKYNHLGCVYFQMNKSFVFISSCEQADVGLLLGEKFYKLNGKKTKMMFEIALL